MILKTSKNYRIMKRIIFLLTTLLLVTSTNVMAQEEQKDKIAKKEAKKAEKEAKKAAKKAEKQALYAEALNALTERKFIIKIDRVQIGNGRFNPVDNRSSFFELNDTTTSSQMDEGSTYSTPKLVYGEASDFNITTDKKGNTTLELTLREKTSIIPKNIKIRLENESNECSMTIFAKKGTRLYIRGILEPLGKTKIFRGTPLIY